MRPFTILGLMRARSYDALAEQQKKTEARATQLARELEEAKANARQWKAKADEAASALKKAEGVADTAQKQWRHADKLKEEHAKRADTLREELDKRRQAERERHADLVALKQRLADSEHELVVAREQLMAVEVKLDILEGAANVLDARTRDVLPRRSGLGTESGSAV
jgi:chromosome segregation ATPase